MMQKREAIVREPIAIGRFYPQSADQLTESIKSFLSGAEEPLSPWAVLLPHAGYMYCGQVLGKTLRGVQLPSTLLLLCPNHTGRGKVLSVWPDGMWKTPLGNFPVAERFTKDLTKDGLFSPDYLAHLGEHSLEVLLPFLACTGSTALPAIIPVCVGTQDPTLLATAGEAVANLLTSAEEAGERIGVVVSSDMNHYESHNICMEKDALALAAIEACDGMELLDVCKRNQITMCGVAPCAMTLFAASHLGKLTVRIVAHTSSGEASGEYRQTVGYAGIRFFLEKTY